MLLCDKDIRILCVGDKTYPNIHEIVAGRQFVSATKRPLLDPFSEGVQGGNVISYGLSHAGYDLRLGYKVLVFKNSWTERVDPKAFKQDKDYQNRLFEDVRVAQGERVWVPPNGYILGYSLEYIAMPSNLIGTCLGKSTLARAGIIINTTPLEPGWHGHLTIEIANASPCPVCLYAGEGCAQLRFELLTGTPEIDYEAKEGKYQAQGSEPVPSKVK